MLGEERKFTEKMGQGWADPAKENEREKNESKKEVNNKQTNILSKTQPCPFDPQSLKVHHRRPPLRNFKNKSPSGRRQ